MRGLALLLPALLLLPLAPSSSCRSPSDSDAPPQAERSGERRSGLMPRPGEVQVLQGQALGTTWLVKAKGRPLAPQRPQVEGGLALIDATFSTWREDSELSRFNRNQGPFEASAPFAALTARALELARETRGAFDPTVGPLVALWGFGALPQAGRPSPDGATFPSRRDPALE